MSQRFQTSTWKSIVAGTLGGLVGALAMNQFQAAVVAVTKAADEKERRRKGWPDRPKERGNAGDDATTKAAQAISSKVFKHQLTEAEKAWASPLVHYSMGACSGAGYGIAAHRKEPDLVKGLGYGTAIWAVADETAVPILGLSDAPTKTPLSGHVKALSSHLVFGAVTHFARKLILSEIMNTRVANVAEVFPQCLAETAKH